MSLLLLTLFLVLAMNMEMTLATLGFEDESYSCGKASDLAKGLFAKAVEGCDVYRSTDMCSSNDSCGDCVWVPDDAALFTCVDGCGYCHGDICVGRSVNAGIALGQLLDNYFTLVQNSLFFAFTEGASGSFELIWDPLGATYDCAASFSGQTCTCQQVYCDENRQTVAPQVNCTGITGGAWIDGCLPNFGLQWKDDMALMEMLVLMPFEVCDNANQQSALPTTPPSTV